MRVGYHPLKKVGTLEPPPDITICMVTFIPLLGGYFEHSLEVLSASLESLWQNTDLPYDLMVFDNGSCAEVLDYLLQQQRAGRIQYLLLSDKNVGLPGAWNALFRAAPGKIIAYSDSDVYFYPGWLREGLQLIEVYPNVGMVTCIPLRSLSRFYTSTLAWAENTPGVQLERGKFQEWDVYWLHMQSLGMTEEQARQKFNEEDDLKIEFQGVPAHVGAGHFQFISPHEALNAVAPFPYVMPMGNELFLDERMNTLGYLRLETTQMYVQHLGNRLLDVEVLASRPVLSQRHPQIVDKTPVSVFQPDSSAKNSWSKRLFYRILDFPLVQKPLHRLYTLIFRWYYERKQNR